MVDDLVGQQSEGDSNVQERYSHDYGLAAQHMRERSVSPNINFFLPTCVPV